MIGRGAFGEVRLVRAHGRLYALKILAKTLGGLADKPPTQQHVAHIRAERDALAALNQHPFIVTLHFTFQSPDHFFVVTDFASGGDLMQILIAKGTLPEPLVRLYAAELVLAIAAVHGAGFLHRDIKPDNILLDGAGHVLLSDLGLSSRSSVGEPPPPHGAAPVAAAGFLAGGGPPPPVPAGWLRPPRALRALSCVGTPDYLAPEVLVAATTGEPYTQTADFWGLGAVLYECLLGTVPFTYMVLFESS